MRVVPVSAPAGGYVTKKNVVLGSYVTPEMTLYEIVDLSRDLRRRRGLPARRGRHPRRHRGSLHARGGARQDGRREGGPRLPADRRRRAHDARAPPAPQRQLKLRPGQYGQVDFELPARKVVVVPARRRRRHGPRRPTCSSTRAAAATRRGLVTVGHEVGRPGRGARGPSRRASASCRAPRSSSTPRAACRPRSVVMPEHGR